MPRTRSILSFVREAKLLENQVKLHLMQETHADSKPDLANDPLATISNGATALTIFLIFLVAATGTLAFLSAQSAEPLVLTLLALLAMLGVFFIFGVAAGHIRISERTPAVDLLESIANQQDNGQLLTTLDGDVLHANHAASRILGRNELGDLNKLEQAFAVSQAGAEVLFRLMRANQRQRHYMEVFETPVTGADPSATRWFRVCVKPFGNVDLPEYAGRAALWNITDITDEQLRSAERVNALRSELAQFTGIPVGIMNYRHDGSIDYINPQLLRHLGCDGDHDTQPLNLSDIVVRHDVEVLTNVAVTDNENSATRFDIDFVGVSGENWPASCIVAPKTPGNRHGVCSLVVHPRQAFDIDRLSTDGVEGQFGSLFRSAPFGIALVDVDGKISASNPAFARLANGAASLPPNSDALTAFAIADAKFGLPPIQQALDAAKRGKAEIQPIEVATGKDGEYARRIYVQSLSASQKSASTAIIYVTDATEERALGQKFAQSQKMDAVGQLAGGIAHDFNNVLTAILGFSDLLLASHRPSDHAYKNIQNIRSSANHAASLVKQLLAFSRRQTLEPEVLQLNELVTDSSVILNRLLGENVELKISSGRDLWAVKADHNQLNQVVINLAVNARDAMPDGGRLTIRTRNVSEREIQRLAEQSVTIGEYVMIEVEDTGVGMAPEIVAKIFEPFFTTKDVGKGTGLGLSTVYGIIKQTEGYVFADSKQGEGTTFRVYLPRHAPDENEMVEAPKSSKKERATDLTGHGRVLVVEDEDAVRIFATEALRRQGYEVLQASDGLEALDVMEDCNHQVDLVVSDVKMPEMDGPTLFKELRKTNPAIKFIFVSGYTDDAFTKTLDADAKFKFMPKPYTLAQIAEVVKEQLS